MESLEHGSDVQVAGLVVARQRPETARGYTFVLLEDEAGMVNVIVRPQVYERDRIAIRVEPFLRIAGTVAKDDGTVNVIAQDVRPLSVGRDGRTGSPPTQATGVRDQRPVRMAALLKDLRRHAPGSRNWG